VGDVAHIVEAAAEDEADGVVTAEVDSDVFVRDDVADSAIAARNADGHLAAVVVEVAERGFDNHPRSRVDVVDDLTPYCFATVANPLLVDAEHGTDDSQRTESFCLHFDLESHLRILSPVIHWRNRNG